MATILTVTANPLLDHLARARMAVGTATRVAAFEGVAGGKGINVGRVLVRHGHRVIATGFAGGSTGAQLAALIASDGMEPALVPTAARSRIGFLVEDSEASPTAITQVMEHGFAVSAEEQGALVEEVRRLVPSCALCIIGGSVPDSRCVALFSLILGICHQAGVPCWVDAYGPAMDAALDGAHPPALVKPNREEYGASGKRWLGASELHLTDGPREVRVRHPDGRFRVTPPSVRCRNAVGSGDSYLAGLAHARLSGWRLVDQLRYAAAAGAANAAAGTIGSLTPAEVEALVGAVTVRDADD